MVVQPGQPFPQGWILQLSRLSCWNRTREGNQSLLRQLGRRSLSAESEFEGVAVEKANGNDQ